MAHAILAASVLLALLLLWKNVLYFRNAGQIDNDLPAHWVMSKNYPKHGTFRHYFPLPLLLLKPFRERRAAILSAILISQLALLAGFLSLGNPLAGLIFLAGPVSQIYLFYSGRYPEHLGWGFFIGSLASNSLLGAAFFTLTGFSHSIPTVLGSAYYLASALLNRSLPLAKLAGLAPTAIFYIPLILYGGFKERDRPPGAGQGLNPLLGLGSLALGLLSAALSSDRITRELSSVFVLVMVLYYSGVLKRIPFVKNIFPLSVITFGWIGISLFLSELAGWPFLIAASLYSLVFLFPRSFRKIRNSEKVLSIPVLDREIISDLRKAFAYLKGIGARGTVRVDEIYPSHGELPACIGFDSGLDCVGVVPNLERVGKVSYAVTHGGRTAGKLLKTFGRINVYKISSS